MGVWRWRVHWAMEEDNDRKGVPRLLDLKALGAYLGRPHRSLERHLKKPPRGFPKPIRFGRLVFWSRDQIDSWLLGSSSDSERDAVDLPAPTNRSRGRPRKRVNRAQD